VLDDLEAFGFRHDVYWVVGAGWLGRRVCWLKRNHQLAEKGRVGSDKRSRSPVKSARVASNWLRAPVGLVAHTHLQWVKEG
jgi:hypothetical protein